MALPLQEALRLLLTETVKKPQLIVEIEGLPVFGSLPVQKYALYDEDGIYYDLPGLVYDGLILDSNALSYIDMSNTTSSITQQMLVDKGGTSSITSFDVSLVDKNGIITEYITPGKTVNDILAKKVRCYLSLEGAGHPKDSVLFFNGIVAGATAGAGYVNFNFASSEKLKSLEIFPKLSTELTADVFAESVKIQGLLYQKRTDVIGAVSVVYTSGASKGSEIVTVLSNVITVQIDDSGTGPTNETTAKDIQKAIEGSNDASSLVVVSIISGESSTVQTIQASTFLITSSEIFVSSTTDFSLPADSGTLTTYIKIDNEIISYTGKTDISFTGCIRGQRGTDAETHTSGTNVESAYGLTGNLRDLSLKLMLSGLNTAYLTNEPILAFNIYGLESVQDAIFVNRYNFDDYYGTVSGDSITISGAINAGNNGTTTISSIVDTDTGSYLILNKTLINEGLGATFSLTSKYAVLPKFCGLEMTPDQVDIAEFERIYDQFSPAFFEYDFYIDEAVKGDEFIDTEILYPSGAYSLPRKAKTSLGLTIPPLAAYEIKTLNDSNVIKANQLAIKRNISNNFYNAIVIKYDKSPTLDKFLRGKIRQSANSTNRIPIANRPLAIEAKGVRAETNFSSKFNTIARRFLDRYQYGAESINVDVNYGTGFTIEIGDTVILDGQNLKISDIKDINATRVFKPRLFEVQNKTLNLRGSPISLTLVDTAFSLNGRYGVISPSSKIDTGSTTTILRLKKSYGTNLKTRSENFKWTPMIGSSVRIFNQDYTFSEESVITGLDPANNNGIIISPALSIAPPAGYFVTVINYPNNTNAADQVLSKAMYVYFNNQIKVVSGISNFIFTVSGPALTDIKVGYLVRIHNDDYSRYSGETTVTDITGNTVTVDKDLTFTPQLDDRIELLGFNDNGKPYLWL